jgi:hypothetical protein
MSKKKILFTTGSMNQITQMHQVYAFLCDEYDCYFSQLFDDHPVVVAVQKAGFLENTILGNKFIRQSEDYFKKNNLKSDLWAKINKNNYDLVLYCSDLVNPKIFKNVKKIWVQEGMIDRLTNWSKMIRKLKLPGYLGMNTSLNGSSDLLDIYFAASNGYKQKLAELGTDRNKIFVTGMPNYDNCENFLHNDFPHKNYVLVCTSDMRETFVKDDRAGFIKRCVEIADGRALIFKLHPNENVERATEEIKANAPVETLIFSKGNTDHMIANCDELITQYSTVVFTGLALGKKSHSYFDMDELKQLLPQQNNGTSAKRIAEICRDYIEWNGTRNEFLRREFQKVIPKFSGLAVA